MIARNAFIFRNYILDIIYLYTRDAASNSILSILGMFRTAVTLIVRLFEKLTCKFLARSSDF